jgi:hypothetical protein
MKKLAKNWLLLLLLGIGDGLRVHIIGLMALSELVIFFLAPILYFKNVKLFKNAGFTTFFTLIFLMIIGTVASAWYNGTWMFACLKNCAVLYSIFAYSVVLFLLLKDDFKGLGWLFLGLLIASILVIWGFNTSLHVDESIGTAELVSSTSEEVMSGVRFWNSRISRLLKLPIISSNYLNLPTLYPLIALPVAAVVSMIMSVSGRSDAAITVMGLVLILIAKKSRRRMQLVGRHLIIFTICVLCLAVLGKNVYKYTASKGWLGEHARAKYYAQTKRGQSILSILMAGRAEFFIGMRAVMDHPIMGFGTMAKDNNGYWADFMWKYGDIDDYELFNRLNSRREQYGGYLNIPVHSFIVGFWGQSGIIGLVFSIYIFYLVYIFFRRYSHAIPNWYGYFACSLPGLLWSMLFSPYGHGVGAPMLFTGLLMARAVGQGRLVLPYEIELEARKYD